MRGHYLIEQNYLMFSENLPNDLRASLLKSCDLTCMMCGIGPGQIDSYTGLRAILHLDCSNGKVLIEARCSICIEGRREARLA